DTSHVILADASAPSTIYGDNAFYDFTSTTPSKIIYFEKDKTQMVLGTWKIQGEFAKHIKLLSTEPGKQWKVNPQGPRDISYAWVEDSYNIHPEIVVMTGSTNRGNSINWDPFITWTNVGGDSLWSNPLNWSAGVTPGAGDDAVFDGTSNTNSTVDTDFSGSLGGILMNAGYTSTITVVKPIFVIRNLGAASQRITINSGTFNANGKIVWIGITEPPDPFLVISGGTYLMGAPSVAEGGGIPEGHLIVNDDRFPDVFNPNRGGITMTGGTFIGSAGRINVNGTVNISGGSFTSSSWNLQIFGNFVHTGGIFDPNGGSVVLDGRDQSISGSTTFNNLTKTTSVARTLTVEAGSTQTVAGTTTLQGAAGNLLSLRSSSAGTQWNIAPQGGRSISFVDVKDSVNTVLPVINPPDSIDSGNTVNWFPPLIFIWTGALSRDWGTAGNWDVNLVPFPTSDVIIPDVVNDPILDVERMADDVTLGNGALLTLDGKNFTATGVLSNDGTVRLNGSETVSLTQDTNSGTFEYVGNANGSSNTFNLIDFGATDYFNLHVNTTDTSDIIQLTQPLTIVHDLTLSQGILSLNNQSLTMTGATFSNNAVLRLQGNETVANLVQDIDSGTWEYVGRNLSEILALKEFGGTDYFNLIINDQNTNRATFSSEASKSIAGAFTIQGGTYDANANTTTVTGLTTVSGGIYQASTNTQTLNGGLTMNGGTFTGSTGAVDVNSDVSLSSGTLTAPTGPFTVSGNWTKTGGVFDHSNATVTFDGIGAQLLNSGASSFFNVLHNNTGTLRLSSNNLTALGTLTNTSGIYDANDLETSVTGLTTVSGGEYQAKTALQTLDGGLTINGGTFTGSTGSVDVNSDVSLSSGTLTAPTGPFTVSGNWTKTGGVFDHSSSTVTFDGTGTQLLNSGGSDFFNLLH
ncbi:MAG: hypothetical protein HY593_01810, partial [Candidatus Omnitrophica bacterium]|nr:hypothetical protein [Candidatus Omnitrophota bacterium]